MVGKTGAARRVNITKLRYPRGDRAALDAS